MRISEFEKDAIEGFAKLRDIDVSEALPALAALGRMAGGAVAKKATQTAADKIQAAKSGAADKVGATATQKPKPGSGQATAQKIAQKTQQEISKDLIKKGSKVPMPTQSGGAKDFEIDDVNRDEVTIINPDARRKPEEPEKLIYKKDDIENVVKTLGQRQQ